MTQEIDNLSLYLTIMANGPANWAPEQVKSAYDFAKSLQPKVGQAEVLSFTGRDPKIPLDRH